MKRPFQFGLVMVFAACSGEMDESALPEQSAQLDRDVPVEPSQSEVVEPSESAFGEITQSGYAPRTYDELSAAFHAGFDLPLSDSERATAEEFLLSTGVDLTEVQIQGRIIVHDDTFRSVDSILSESSQVIEKGAVVSGQTRSSKTGANSPAYARMNGANLEMWKPYFGMSGVLKVIVPNAFVASIVQPAVTAVLNAADDCLTATKIQVILQSDWNALGQAQVGYARMVVAYGAEATVCPFSPPPVSGCTEYPHAASIEMNFQGGTEVRVLPGGYMGLDSADVTGPNAFGVAVATHELLHALGLGHTYSDGSTYLKVPGSQGQFASTSIMRPVSLGATNWCPAPLPACTNSLSMSADDKYTLDTLYSAQPGSSCSFPKGPETACPLACTSVSPLSVDGDCCWCNGTLRTFKRSAFSTTTYLCQ
jgi:hypothetical protein